MLAKNSKLWLEFCETTSLPGWSWIPGINTTLKLFLKACQKISFSGKSIWSQLFWLLVITATFLMGKMFGALLAR